MKIINVTEAPIEGQPELVAALDELLADVAADDGPVLLHDISRCTGYTYHGNACGVRATCRRYTDEGGERTSITYAPDECVDGCADLMPVAQD